jgi:hypothetical protein
MPHHLKAGDLATQLFEKKAKLAKKVALLAGRLRIGHGAG